MALRHVPSSKDSVSRFRSVEPSTVKVDAVKVDAARSPKGDPEGKQGVGARATCTRQGALSTRPVFPIQRAIVVLRKKPSRTKVPRFSSRRSLFAEERRRKSLGQCEIPNPVTRNGATGFPKPRTRARATMGTRGSASRGSVSQWANQGINPRLDESRPAPA